MSIRITPLVNTGNTVELSKGSHIYEKQVLPYGKFGYKDDSFEITPEWVDDVIKAFQEKAFDQTVFALADENNSHDVDDRPDRFAGEVIQFKKTDTGLSAVFRLTNKSAELVDDTDKKLGVSVRFRENYKRDSDGKSWPVVIDQVLGTTDPRITGMDPWKVITLSNIATNDQNDVKDSSNEEWEEMTAPKVDDSKDKPANDKPANDGTDKITLTKAEYDQFKSLLAAQAEDDSELDKLVDELENQDKKTKETAPVGLSNEAKRVIELSHQVAYGRYERDALAWKQAGVPPKIVELAASVLASYEPVRTVSLSNGKETVTDARDVIRAILEECKGTIDLSNEKGHTTRGAQEDKEEEALRKIVMGQVSQF